MDSILTYLNHCPEIVKQAFTYLTFDTFDQILLQNESVNSVYIIKSGKAKVYSLSSNGTKYLEYICQQGELFGELEVFTKKPILNYVEALELCEILQLSKEMFYEWLKQDPEFSFYITSQLALKMYNACVVAKANIIYPLRYKLLFFLWRYCNEHNVTVVPKDMIVEGVGTNIRSANRIIKELETDGLILYRNGIIIILSMKQLVFAINEYL